MRSSWLNSMPDADMILIVNRKAMWFSELLAMDRSAVQILNVTGCTGLKALPDLPAVRALYATRCAGLTELPDLPAVQILHVEGCTGLKALPDLPAVCTIEARGCTGLTALPDLPAVRILNLECCTGLTALPDLPAVRILNLEGCTGLTALIRPGRDRRGYEFIGVKLRSHWRVLAGCRILDFADALTHWGAGGQSDSPECLALVQTIIARAAEIDADARPDGAGA